MATPGRVDYHVHYHLDGCASNVMTLPAIDATARSIGLEEIVVLKHYSKALPNGENDWVFWHKIKPEQFETYLREFSEFEQKPGLRIYTGVETELMNDDGEIAIDEAALARIDSVALSAHYLPAMKKIDPPFLRNPGCEGLDPATCPEYKAFLEQVKENGAEYYVKTLADAYIAAMKRYPKIHQLAHMCDGLGPLREYGIDLSSVSESKLVEMMEPMMKTMVECDVRWELAADPVTYPAILRRADEMGVLFVATADAHNLGNSGDWGIFENHNRVEEFVDSFGLHKGVINW